MSTLRVTIEPLTIHPHPNADALELAEVGMLRAIVRKGQFTSRDYALYIPEQAVLPAELIEELGLTGKLAGKDHDRVAAVRLRGELSQGIICRPKALADLWDGDPAHLHDVTGEVDFAERLGITKWVPPIPPSLAGDVEPAPDLMPWIEIESIARYPQIFVPGEPVTISEKLHGSAVLYTWCDDGREYVSSKGVGAKRLAIKESDTNLYWRTVRALKLRSVAEIISEKFGADRVGIFGEVFGKGVQDLHYGADVTRDDTIGYRAFDIRIREAGGMEPVFWLDPEEFTSFAQTVALPIVPQLYTGPYDEETVKALATGTETVTGDSANIREGVVVRSSTERYSELLRGRAIGKYVSPAYLERKNGTEFE